MTSQPTKMLPYYADDAVEIYLADSSACIPTLGLKNHDVVHVVTDPPYGIGLEYGRKIDSWRPGRDYWQLLYDALPENASLHMTVSNKHLPYWLEEVGAAGWEYQHCSVYWNSTRMGGNWNGQYAYAWEPLVSFKKGAPFKLGKRMLSDVFRHDGCRTTDHPAERDIAAWSAFISHLPPGLILDPFMGSGTTLRSALDQGRPAIGIEQEEPWVRDAVLRCSQLSLFVS